MDKLALDSKKVKVLDGSFAFQLAKYVGKAFDGDPLWSAKYLAENPEAVVRVHMDYLKIGCDIIETNSYQASIPGFMKYLNYSKDDSYKLIKKAAQLAKTAVERCREQGIFQNEGKTPLVAGSVGSYGAYLHDGSEYTGIYTDHTPKEVFVDYHRPKIQALIEGGVDLLAIETIPSKKEAEILVELIKEFPSIKAWLSFSCQSDGVTTVHGDNFKESALHCYNLNPQQIVAVGINCTMPSVIEKLITGINDNNNDNKPIPLIIYANSGEKYKTETGWNNKPDKLDSYISTWLNLGVKYIGGCCRVCANDIANIKKEVEKWEILHSKI